MSAYNLVPVAIYRVSQNAGFFALSHPYSWAKRVPNTAICIHQLNVALQEIGIPQVVVGRDEPDIFSTGCMYPFVVVSELSQVFFISYVSDARIVE
jgi:hypothetical protein